MSAAVEEALEDVLLKHGRLTGEVVVKEAEDPAHPLHDRFDWDDSDAAAKWRVHQAEGLIRSIKVRRVTPTGDSQVYRRFVSRREIGEVAPGEFVTVESVVGNPDREDALLRQMMREIETLRRRYSAYEDLFAEALRRSTGT